MTLRLLRLPFLTIVFVLTYLGVDSSESKAQVRRNLGDTSRPATSTNQPQPSSEESKESDDTDEQSADAEATEPVDPEDVAERVERDGPIWLLKQPAVQEELRISEEKVQQLERVSEQIDSNRRRGFEQLRDQVRNRGGRGGPGGGFDRGQMSAMFNQLRQQSEYETQQALGQILTRDQYRRLSEIILQAKGPMAITEPAIRELLNMTPEQHVLIEQVLQQLEQQNRQSGQARMQLFRQMRDAQRAQEREQENSGEGENENNSGRGRGFQISPEFQPQFDSLTRQRESAEQEALKEIGKALSSQQLNKFRKLRGTPFDFNLIKIEPSQGRGGGTSRRGGR